MGYIGNIPALDYISYAVQNFTVTAGTTVYTLDYSVSNENDIRLVINNVIQRPGASYGYSATGTTLTLTSATNAGDTMYAVFIGRAVQTVVPPASSITNTMLAPSVITGQTAVTTPATDDVLLCYDTSATALRKITFADFGNTPSFFVYLNAAQTNVANATYTKVLFDTEKWDTHSAFASNKFTVPTGYGGKYSFSWNLRTSAIDDAEQVRALIYLNGGALYSSEAIFYSSTTDQQIASVGTFIISLVAGDYIELYGYHNEGVARSFFGGDPFAADTAGTWLSGYKLIGV